MNSRFLLIVSADLDPETSKILEQASEPASLLGFVFPGSDDPQPNSAQCPAQQPNGGSRKQESRRRLFFDYLHRRPFGRVQQRGGYQVEIEHTVADALLKWNSVN